MKLMWSGPKSASLVDDDGLTVVSFFVNESGDWCIYGHRFSVWFPPAQVPLLAEFFGTIAARKEAANAAA